MIKLTALELYNLFPLNIDEHRNPRYKSWDRVIANFEGLANSSDYRKYITDNFYMKKEDLETYIKAIEDKTFRKDFLHLIKD